MAKKRRSEPEEGGSGYNWMDTYGDMVTLLLCFFVLLYSFSTIDAQKWQELVGAFSGSSSPSAIESIDISSARAEPIGTIDPMVNYSDRNDKPDSVNVKDAKNNTDFDQLYENIKKYISENHLEDQLSVERTSSTIILRFGEVFLFRSGDATLLPTAREALKSIIGIIGQNIGSIKTITIEGNTDNVPIHNSSYVDNWDLSVQRAVNTLRGVQSYNIIDAGKLAAVGYGEYRPIATNTTAEGRGRNRRVDFVIQKMSTDT